MATDPADTIVPTGAFKAMAWFFDNSLDTFVTIHGETVHSANATWRRLTGWSNRDTVGKPFWSFVHPDDMATARDAVALLPLGERTVREHRLRTRAGDWLWVRSHVVRGEENWILLIIHDMTEERRRQDDAEEGLRAAGLLRAAAGVTIWRYNPDQDRYEINPDFARPAGRADSAFRIEGAVVRPSVHRADAPGLQQAWQRSLQTGEVCRQQYRERAPEGGWRHVRAAWQGVRRLPSGKWEIVGVAQDVTELVQARDAAVQGQAAANAATDAKSQFLANMSHEIRTPMNGVVGLLHMLKTEPSAKTRSRLIDEALSSGAKLSALLGDIIDYADLESGRLVLAREAVDAEEQLGMVLELLQPQVLAKGVGLDVACAGNIQPATVDPGRLRQMFLHLVGNAVKFTPVGSVKVRLSAVGTGEAQRLRLEVADTGIGIAPELQQNLFEHFRQADNSATRQFGGVGLGLTVTRNLARLMDGDITFTSKPGVGSTFWLEIAAPARAVEVIAPDAVATDPAETGGWLEGLKVLVVEDNPTNRLVATGMLTQLGARVETAEDGAEGVAAVERSHFDLIFMDIQMPVMDGMEASRRIRAMPSPRCDIPIVATTANVMPAQLAAYRQCGVNGVVAKPISPGALVSELTRIASDGEAAA